MGKMNVKNGTPVGTAYLCRNCNWAQIVTGYRESDMVVICSNVNPSFVVPFVVCDCSDFSDKNKPTWEQMKKLAVEIAPVRVSRKTRGFETVASVRPASGPQVTSEDHEKPQLFPRDEEATGGDGSDTSIGRPLAKVEP